MYCQVLSGVFSSTNAGPGGTVGTMRRHRIRRGAVPVRALKEALAIGRTTAYKEAHRIGVIRVGGVIRVRLDRIRAEYGEAIAHACAEFAG